MVLSNVYRNVQWTNKTKSLLSNLPYYIFSIIIIHVYSYELNVINI